MLYIPAHFSDEGAPLTGLSPVISILETATGIAAVSEAAMAEVGLGFYRYAFATWNPAKDYCYLVDGGAALENYQRYRIGSTGMAGAVQQVLTDTGVLRDVEQGDWRIDTAARQMVFYSRSGAELMRFNLLDKNGVAAFDDVFERRRVLP